MANRIVMKLHMHNRIPTPSIEAFIESLESVSFQYFEYVNERGVRIHSLKALNRFLYFYR